MCKLYSFHRISDYIPPSFSFFPQVPSGNICRIVDEKFGNGKSSNTSDDDDAFIGRSSSELFDVDLPVALLE